MVPSIRYSGDASRRKCEMVRSSTGFAYATIPEIVPSVTDWPGFSLLYREDRPLSEKSVPSTTRAGNASSCPEPNSASQTRRRQQIMLTPFRLCQGANAGEKAGPDRPTKPR